VLYPFVFCIYNIVAILDGLIYFRQTDRLPPLHAGLIGLGTFILLSGVLALSWRLQDDDECDSDEAHRHQMAQAEIPQTVLAPGMGFVAEPDSDTASNSPTDEETGSEEDLHRSTHSEQSPLLGKVRSGRGSHGAHSPATTRRRKRASTLKEIYSIWEELGDGTTGDDEEQYGTFANRRRSSAGNHPVANTTTRSRPHSSGGQEAAMIDGAIESDTTAVAETEDQRAGLLRSNSLPLGRRSRSNRRRRHSRTGQGALFSDMLRVEWWRSRRRRHGSAVGEEGAVEHSRPRDERS
jgi:hypothetical protein